MIHQHNHQYLHQYLMKQLNIENWSCEHVCEWLKGLADSTPDYLKQFETSQIDGKKLCVTELTDLKHYLNINLKQQLSLFKSIQSLLQIKHDLNKDTLQNLIFNVHNKIVLLLNIIERIENCACHLFSIECEKCARSKKYEIISASSQLALSYRKLISWLVRIPFTRLKAFSHFREEINNEMKNFLRSIRKNLTDKHMKEISIKLNTMLNSCKKMLNYCDHSFDEENGKIGCAFSNCFLEKVKIRRTNPDQILGLKLTSLQDGVYTIAEILRESAADECSQLNVEDDIVFVDSQIVIGWSSENIVKFLEKSFNSNGAISLILRKMPKDHINSIKQQKNLALIYKNHANRINNIKKQSINNKAGNSGHQRKLSFSDMFISEDFIINDSSDEEEECYDSKMSSTEQLNKENDKSKRIVNTDDEMSKKDEILYEKNKNKKDSADSAKKSKTKFEKKSSRNRLIKSMQNLFFYDKSRSVSSEALESNNESHKKIERKKSIEEAPSPKNDSNNKSDLLKSFFKRADNKKNSFEFDASLDTPNLINVKRLDSFKRDQTSSNDSPKTVSSKPPIDKRSYKLQIQKPAMQGWLFKQRQSSSASALAISTHSSSNTKLLKSQLNQPIKWKKYWCVLMKDYITFYKQIDDKIPKDFLLLKDFEIKEGSKKYGFILLDNMKQVSHEFYAEQADEFNEWNQALTELRNRLNGEPINSLSNTSLSSSSGYDTLGLNSSINNNDLSSVSSFSPHSLPTNRKNNLQLQLSTIIDLIDDSSSSFSNNNENKTQQHSSPTLAQHQQQSYSSSRESSPDPSNCNSKLQSRDSSPAYQLDPEPYTSESDAEVVYSKSINNEKPDTLVLRNKNSSVISSAVANAATGLNSSKQKSSSPSPSSATSVKKFVYDEQIEKDQQHFKSNKSASLPGTLQFCVGSYLNSNTKQKLSDIEENTSPMGVVNPKLMNKPVPSIQEKLTQIPSNFSFSKPRASISSITYHPNSSLYSSLNNEFNSSPRNSPPVFQAISSHTPSYSTKAFVNPSNIQMNRQHFSPHSYLYHNQSSSHAQNQLNLSKTSPLNSNNISKISVQVKPSLDLTNLTQKPSTNEILKDSARASIGKFCFLPSHIEHHLQQQQQQQSQSQSPTLGSNPSSKTFAKNSTIALQSPNSPSVVYRTELTIMPSSYNNNASPPKSTSSFSSPVLSSKQIKR